MRSILCLIAVLCLGLFAVETQACDQFRQQLNGQCYSQQFIAPQAVYLPVQQVQQQYYVPSQRQAFAYGYAVANQNLNQRNNHHNQQGIIERSQQRRADRAALRAQQLQQRANHH